MNAHFRYVNLFWLLSFALLTTSFLSEAQAKPRSPLTAEIIQRAMQKHRPQVRKCYVKHALAQQQADGRVTLELVVRASGAVKQVGVSAPSVDGERFALCVTRIAKKWTFPESSYRTVIRYPFWFVHTHAAGAGPVLPRRARPPRTAQKGQ